MPEMVKIRKDVLLQIYRDCEIQAKTNKLAATIAFQITNYAVDENNKFIIPLEEYEKRFGAFNEEEV